MDTIIVDMIYTLMCVLLMGVTIFSWVWFWKEFRPETAIKRLVLILILSKVTWELLIYLWNMK